MGRRHGAWDPGALTLGMGDDLEALTLDMGHDLEALTGSADMGIQDMRHRYG